MDSSWCLGFAPAASVLRTIRPGHLVGQGTISSRFGSNASVGVRLAQHRGRATVRPQYAPTMSVSVPQGRLHVLSDKAGVGAEAALCLAKQARKAIEERDVFVVALSGGSLPSLVAKGISQLSEEERAGLAMEKWKVLLADERCVSLDHEDSNYRLVRENFPDIPAEHVIPIDPSLSPSQCAADYEQKVKTVIGGSNEGKIDAVWLGLGPDGHTASLFPDHELLNVKEGLVVEITDSPKPPPERITLTLPFINAASAVAFVCTGDGKATVVKDIMENPQSALPGALVRPSSGELDWFIDAGAASLMQK